MPVSQGSFPPQGTCRYGVVQFGAFSSSEQDVRPVYDAAGRTVIHLVFTLTVQTKLAGGPTDPVVKAMVTELMKPAQDLIYQDVGGVPLTVTGGGLQRDVVWGPKPLEARVKPLGQGNGCELTWRCEVAVPFCGDAKYRFFPMEFNYRLKIDLDQAGYSKRTVTGFLRIPMGRRNPDDRTLVDNIDSYREDVTPALLEGFHRTHQTFDLNDAKDRIDFQFVDDELPPNLPPPGVIQADGSHTYHNYPRNPKRWTGTLRARYELRRGASPDDAIRAFFELARARVGVFNLPFAVPLGPFGRPLGIPVTFKIGEPSLYGRTTLEFELTYDVVGATLADLLAIGGLWRPISRGPVQLFGATVVPSDWKEWQKSLGPVLGPRGAAGLVFNPGDDGIVDLCKPVDPRPPKAQPPQRPGVTQTLRQGLVQQLLPTVFPDPTPAQSFIAYENDIYLEVDSGTVPVRTLPTLQEQQLISAKPKPARPRPRFIQQFLDTVPGAPPVAVPWDTLKDQFPEGVPQITAITGADGATAAAKLGVAFAAAQKAGTWARKAVMQRVRPLVYVHLIGRAARYGYQIPIPQLTEVNGMSVTLACRLDRGEGFRQGVRAAAGDTPVYTASWDLRYACDDIPDGPLPIPPNPFAGDIGQNPLKPSG